MQVILSVPGPERRTSPGMFILPLLPVKSVFTTLVYRYCGNWLFRHRRWLDPSVFDDLQMLNRGFRRLCELFPVPISESSFLRILSEAHGSWSALMIAAPDEDSRTVLQVHSQVTITHSGHNDHDPRINSGARDSSTITTATEPYFSPDLIGKDGLLRNSSTALDNDACLVGDSYLHTAMQLTTLVSGEKPAAFSNAGELVDWLLHSRTLDSVEPLENLSGSEGAAVSVGFGGNAL